MTGTFRITYLVFCLAIGFVVWLLAYGVVLQLLYGDGRILQVTATTNPFAALQQLARYPHNAVLQRTSLGAAAVSVLIAGAIASLGLKRASEPLGNARFQNTTSLRHGRWFRRHGHILGRYGRHVLRVQDERHHLVIGPTRSGKGTSYVIPNALTHQGSMIVTDLKGEIFRSTAGYRKATGNQVFLFAPGSERTHRYNPLDFIRPDRGDRTTDILNIASILVPESADSENAIWQATAQLVLAGAISYVNESDSYRGRRNLGEVISFFNSGVDLQALMSLIKEKEPNLSRFTLESFNAYIALSERAAASALLDVQKALRPFRNERVVAATEVTDMDLRALKHRPISIYLAPNITDVAMLKPLLSLFVQQSLDTLLLTQDQNSLPIYFLLDEFRQLRKVSEITSKLPYVAGYNIKMAFIIQDLKNLDEIYGETARHSLMGNCGYQLVLGANDQVTAESVSRGLGKKTVRYRTESRTIELMGLHRRTKVEQVRERDLMMPQEVRQMPADKMVILVEGQAPVLADKLRFFATSPFKAMERFSRSTTPDVPATELLPRAAIPALTDAYSQSGASEDRRIAAFGTAHPPTPPSGAAIEARFVAAARKLKQLTTTASERSSGKAKRNWSALFDEIVPDDPTGQEDDACSQGPSTFGTS
ncbi:MULTISPECIES: type IV secretory system conjugative DNA transfer family protein [unclassified Mesorhizobium]|uniref:type IV secretory system conjugative DNA transfer family protein n=1 Tax=unclassified Mesorhizobium TaxID=325217 RepID=UPI001125D143|nr:MULTISPECIES: type IV secretory system conjugative DNA transfer family protein [unclassified Mesorhizobium]MBZ9974062.1 type IV secretory system conjugative DNA transfer family protein [Mesorhizobium sp. BR-1-1-10]TPK10417.1 type IV secretory system conjugative DNA transfer family protein [Mesorhizobium sp. B2-5-7]